MTEVNEAAADAAENGVPTELVAAQVYAVEQLRRAQTAEAALAEGLNEAARLGDRITELQTALDAAGRSADRMAVRAGEQEALVTLRTRDLGIVANMLRDEAVRRDWCSDYGTFVDQVNGATDGEWLYHCTEERVASFTVSVTYTCRYGQADTCYDELYAALADSDGYELSGSDTSIEDIDITRRGNSVP